MKYGLCLLFSAALCCAALVGSAVMAPTSPAVFGDTSAVDWSVLLGQVQAIAASFGPWGLLVAAGIGVYLRFRKSPSPSPVPSPVPGPVPGPVTPPSPTPGPTGRPIIDSILKILGVVAMQRFPGLEPAVALEKHLVEMAHVGMSATADGKEKPAA